MSTANLTTDIKTKGIEKFKESRAKVWRNRNNRATLVSRLFAAGKFEAPDAFSPTNMKIDYNIGRLRTCLYADALYDGEARRRDTKGNAAKKDPALTKLQKLLKVAREEAVERDLLRSAMPSGFVTSAGGAAFMCTDVPPPESCPPSPVYSASPPRPYSPTMPEHAPEPQPVEM